MGGFVFNITIPLASQPTLGLQFLSDRNTEGWNVHEACTDDTVGDCVANISGVCRLEMTSTCPVCYETFHRGWAYFHHKKRPCAPPNGAGTIGEARAHPFEPTFYEDDDAVPLDAPPLEERVNLDGGSCTESDALTRHFDNPEHDGLLRYWGWGAKPLTSRDRQILDFLAVVDGAGGMSTAAGNRVLKYVRGGGSKSKKLPKSIKTCWNHVNRVRTFARSQCDKLQLMYAFQIAINIQKSRHIKNCNYISYNDCNIFDN